MAGKKDIEYYLAQARRIAEHREQDAEKEIRRLYKTMLKELQEFISQTYVQYAQDDRLTYAMLQQAGYNARFLEEVEQRMNLAMPEAARELRRLVDDTYDAAYKGMVDGVARASGGIAAEFAGSIAITPEQIKLGERIGGTMANLKTMPEFSRGAEAEDMELEFQIFDLTIDAG